MKRPGVRWWMSFPFRGAAARARDVDDEIALHIGMRADRLVEQGLPRDVAETEARRRFGGDSARHTLHNEAREREKTMRQHEWIASAGSDLRFTLRQLARVPAFTVACVMTLALGVGANATMFGVLDRLLLRAPQHVRAPERVMQPTVSVQSRNGFNRQAVLSFPIFLDLASDSAFAVTAAYGSSALVFGSGPSARELNGLRVTPAYFAVLGPQPLLGRFFDASASPEQPAESEVVLSESFWRSAFGGAAEVLGQSVELSGTRYRVIGVAPQGFRGTGTTQVDAWVPYAALTTPARIAEWKSNRQWYSLRIVARLRDGVSREAAATSASLALRRGELRDGIPPAQVEARNATVTLASALPREARGRNGETRVAVLLGAMSVVVLLLACANIINLQLGRAIRRQREVAVRLALGVSKGRLVRLLLTESVALALLGGGAALVLAWWGTTLMHRTLLSNFELAGAPLDVRMTLFTLGIAIGAGVVTGLFPAIQAGRGDLIASLRTGRQPGSSSARTRFWLLVTQSALALVLLIGTGLFARSLARIDAVPLGMEAGSVLVVSLNVRGDEDDARLATIYRELEAATARTPGVEAAALTFSLPFGATTAAPVHMPGRDSLPVTSQGGPYVNAVGADYFAALGTPIVEGRAFTGADREGSAPVAIVNQTTARLWWPGERAVGQCLQFLEPSAPCTTVVGVAANTRRQSIVEEESVQAFVPAAQAEWAQPRTVVARVRGDTDAMAQSLGRALRSIPGLPYVSVRPLASRVDSQMRSWRLGATMFAAFALLAIVLAGVGLYGLLAFEVSKRTREIGVRLALGGTPLGVSSLVAREGVRAVATGCALGLVAALALGTRIEPLLFQTSRLDPLVYAAALLVILATAVVATWLPARRASRVAPAIALQAE